MSPEYRTPNYVRSSVSSACPTSLPGGQGWRHTQLDAIPPTPAAAGNLLDEEVNPFDMGASVSPTQQLPDIRVQQAVMCLM